MDDMKLKLSQSVAARLGAAPNSKEKDEPVSYTHLTLPTK